MRPELEIVREWIAKAAQDLEGARRVMAPDPPLLELACFCCQQAVEKALKGYLEFCRLRPPKTHGLAELFDLAQTQDEEFATLRSTAWLSTFAVAGRYPGFETALSVERANKAIEDATSVLAFVLARVPDEVHP